MTDAKAQGMFSVSYSLSDFQSVAFQLGFYFKITEEDMVGVSSQSLLLPNTFSYVRLWDNSSMAGNYQVHINNLVTANHSPTYEFRTAFYDDTRNPRHSFEAGIGVYSTPLLYGLAGRRIPLSITPVLAYQYRGEEYAFQAQYIHGYSDYKGREILSYTNSVYDYTNNKWIDGGPELIFENHEIRSFEKTDSNSWIIEKKDGEILTLAESDPFPDCFGCAINAGKLKNTLPDPNYRVFWLNLDEAGGYVILNIGQAYEDYLNGDPVDLRPGKDYLQLSLKKNRFLLDDISVSAGIQIRE
ncbi:hypothetical protein AB2B38_006630 [Balneola sp. MJW-20]|uniref:hypothetical protein n=1 Tax=Gracilimonas aurantiaca TaxID=3234185 RepID=UPI003467E6CC